MYRVKTQQQAEYPLSPYGNRACKRSHFIRTACRFYRCVLRKVKSGG